MKLRCISCKRRGETEASTLAEWFFRPLKNKTFYKIYEYRSPEEDTAYGVFENRIEWGGSKDTTDIQEATIYLHNVTFEDAGTYKCYFNRTFLFKKGEFTFFTQINKTIELTVVPKANRTLASIIGEIMMYFLNVVLTLWLFAEMIYCYKEDRGGQRGCDAGKWVGLSGNHLRKQGGLYWGAGGELGTDVTDLHLRRNNTRILSDVDIFNKA
ncbi:sodium channel regulatory subunit beta-1-like [Narcine bancroftii]|uniref:sodium channel regulatory subunit beta-1-like n=1 Tax=Narcine bancroftii TaxID=1343680 RepID=UPI00383184E6